MTGIQLPDLGDLLLAIVLFFATAIVLSGCAERRREQRRKQRILDAIEREYQLYFRLGRL